MGETLLGDCFELIKQVPDSSIDVIITDPPYILDSYGGTTNNSGFKRAIHDKHFEFISEGFDFETLFPEFERVLKSMSLVLFCSNKQVSSFMSYWENKGYAVTLLIWHKTNPIPFAQGKHLSDVEFIIWVRGSGAFFNNDLHHKMKSKVLRYPTQLSKRDHPTQKPEDLISHLISVFSEKGDKLLDPFAGSGTLGVCCLNMGRDYLQFEIEQEFYDVCIRREQEVQKELKRDAIFAEMFEVEDPEPPKRILAGTTKAKQEQSEKDSFEELFGV